MTEFRKQYQNEPIDFHLWSQDKIAEFWWKKALEWAENLFVQFNSFEVEETINKEFRNGLKD